MKSSEIIGEGSSIFPSEFEQIAQSLNIPVDRWTNPQVKRYIEVLFVLRQFQTILAGSEADTARSGMNLSQTRDIFGNPDMTTKLPFVYRMAETLTTAIIYLMVKDFNRISPNFKEAFMGKVNIGLGPLGLHVTKDKSSDTR